jgi:hypothetical protein
MKEIEKLLPELKLKLGQGTCFIYEVKESNRVSKGTIFSQMNRLSDPCISSWSMYHCSLDDVFFQIVNKYSTPQAGQLHAN